MRKVAALLAGDSRRTLRDPFLGFMLVYPWILAFVLRWALPEIRPLVADRFDLAAYYPYAACLTALLLPYCLGIVLGFQLLEEKELGFLAAVAVTPTGVGPYLALRAGVYAAVGIPLLVAVHEAFGLAEVRLDLLFLLAIAAVPAVPLMALILAVFASDQVEGFAVMKASGFLVMAPLAAPFLPGSWRYLVGVLPTFWPIEAYFRAVDGRLLVAAASAVVAVAFQGAASVALYRRLRGKALA